MKHKHMVVDSCTHSQYNAIESGFLATKLKLKQCYLTSLSHLCAIVIIKHITFNDMQAVSTEHDELKKYIAMNHINNVY